MSIREALLDLIYEKEGTLHEEIRDKVRRFGSRLEAAYEGELLCASAAYYDADLKVAGHEAFVPDLGVNTGASFLEALEYADALSISVLPAQTYQGQEDTLLEVNMSIYVGE